MTLTRAAESAPIQDEDCFMCHDQVNAEKFSHSIHGSNRCTSCHSDIQELPHPEKLKPVQCADCHAIESQIYYSSDHGKAVASGIPAAACLDCHGDPHELLDYRNPESPVHRLNIHKTCGKCHEDSEKMAQYSLLEEAPVASYAETIHGKALLEKGEVQSAVCTDCHGSHDLHAPTNPESKIYKMNVPKTCGKCHENVLQTFQRSIHGKAAFAGKWEAPVCTDCHGEHTIRSHNDPASSVFSSNISEKTCAHCHAAEKIVSKYRLPPDAVKTYLDSYHGLAAKMGVSTVANCASCHGAHDILPSSDPNSSVNKKNLAKTCGRCHPGAGDQLAYGTVHVTSTSQENRIVFYVSIGYVILIVLVIGMMLLHNLLDFSAKVKKHYQKKKAEAKYNRFTKSERLQHALLTLSFVLLAYTGFALRAPHAWWAYPFTLFDVGVDWRGIIHKAMAIIFVSLSIYHLLFLIFTKRGRSELKALKPGTKDWSDFIQIQKYNLGKQIQKPKFKRYNYIEKMEYWALVWGAFIMIATGSMLTFENFFMKFFPKWALDVANAVHFYEAVLATLAILVWHFYFVIFDPDHYPLNVSMDTGKIGKEEEREDDDLQEKL